MTDVAKLTFNLLDSNEEQLKQCAAAGIECHPFVGSWDHDCQECGLSVYVAIHADVDGDLL